DEFFMVRVGGIQQKVQAGIPFGSGADRMPPRVQMERISETVHPLIADQYRCLSDEILPALEREGIRIRGLKDLTAADLRYLHATVFRVTRNSDYEIDDDEVEDLLKTIEEEVRKRRRGAAARLEIEAGVCTEIEQFLTTALDLDSLDVYRIPALLDLTGLFQI